MLKEAALILLLALAAALLVNHLRSNGLDLSAPGEPAAAGAPGEREVTLEEAVRRHADGAAIFADARPSEDFAAGHIQGALSTPQQDLDAWIEAFIAGTDPDAVIIAYCEGAGCSLSKSLVDTLVELGFANARYLVDGWGKWKANHLPVGKGS
jgi:rhodanese-related sulfurtransferase